jgi:hypothetical protein
MGFIANDPEPTFDPDEPDQGSIAGDAFWPAVDLARLREVGRISTVVTPLAVRDAAIGAIIACHRELAAWRAARAAEGKATLAAIDPLQIDGKLKLEHLYVRAVTATAAADLLETRQEVGATEQGRDRVEASEVPGPDWRRIATLAIRDILGVGRTAVELI